MARIVVVGDTHIRHWDEAHEALRALVRDADIAVHCGDWVTMDAVEGFRAEARQAVMVHGNSDYAAVRKALPYREVFEVDGVRIGVTHPAWGAEEPPPHALLPDFPREEVGPLDIICYGHIHETLSKLDHDIHFVNGGQGYPSFRVPGTVAVIETWTGGRFTVSFEEFAPAR
jgi:uncharacterized protein